jgi:hypothetical protein
MTISWPSLSTLETAALICSHLSQHGIDATLVGGTCVSIYSNNTYISGDMDFVTLSPLREIKKALSYLGFISTKGRLFKHPDCPFILDFPASPLAIGNEPVSRTCLLKSGNYELKLLTPEDCVKDRLTAFYYWNDYEALEQAVLVAKENNVSIDELSKWSKNEPNGNKFSIFLSRI